MIRYRAGWLIQGHVLALTHFVPDVTQEDFVNIAQDTSAALQQVDRKFHLIIDNRIIENRNLASLETMLQALPQLNHPQLCWIVMVVPEVLKGTAVTMTTQQHNQIRLMHVDTLPTAYEFLRSVAETIDWRLQREDFFDPYTIAN